MLSVPWAGHELQGSFSLNLSSASGKLGTLVLNVLVPCTFCTHRQWTMPKPPQAVSMQLWYRASTSQRVDKEVEVMIHVFEKGALNAGSIYFDELLTLRS